MGGHQRTLQKCRLEPRHIVAPFGADAFFKVAVVVHDRVKAEIGIAQQKDVVETALGRP